MIELESYDSFIERLASPAPAPGGGAASAMVSILASSLNQMVASLTVGKKKYLQYEGEMKEVLEKSKKIERDLRNFMKEDEDAFNKIIEALKLPKDTEEEKAVRREKLQEATKGAIRTPWKIAASSREVLEIAREVAEHGNSNAITDAACAALFAHSAIEGALYNVKINLSSIKDDQYVSGERTKLSMFLKDSEKMKTEILKIVDRHLGE